MFSRLVRQQGKRSITAMIQNSNVFQVWFRDNINSIAASRRVTLNTNIKDMSMCKAFGFQGGSPRKGRGKRRHTLPAFGSRVTASLIQLPAHDFQCRCCGGATKHPWVFPPLKPNQARFDSTARPVGRGVLFHQAVIQTAVQIASNRRGTAEAADALRFQELCFGRPHSRAKESGRLWGGGWSPEGSAEQCQYFLPQGCLRSGAEGQVDAPPGRVTKTQLTVGSSRP